MPTVYESIPQSKNADRPQATAEPLLDVAQLAEFLGVTPRWIEENSRERCPDPIPHYKLGVGKGTYRRYRPSDVEPWLQRRKKGRAR